MSAAFACGSPKKTIRRELWHRKKTSGARLRGLLNGLPLVNAGGAFGDEASHTCACGLTVGDLNWITIDKGPLVVAVT
jgi:hypothetical protein